MPNRMRFPSTKIFIFSAVAIALAALFTMSLAFKMTGQWRALGVPALPEIFSDTRYVTSAWDCVRSTGCDVFVHGGQWSGWVYPQSWLWFSTLGLGSEHTMAIGFLFVSIFLASVWIIARQATTFESAVLAALLLSPPVLLAMERGNVDLLIFAIVVLAVHFLQRGSLVHRSMSFSLISVATLLKVYPVAAFSVFLTLKPESWKRVIGLVCIVVIGFAATAGELNRVGQLIPQPWDIAVGSKVFLFAVIDNYKSSAWSETVESNLTAFWATAVGIGIVVALFLTKFLLRKNLSGNDRHPIILHLFVVGASIYSLCFITSSSYDYRLIFLLLVFPQLFFWRSSGEMSRWVGSGLIWGCIALFFSGPLTYPPMFFVINELLGWGVFVSLLSLVLITGIQHAPPLPRKGPNF
jgi:hypothetical protein